VSNPNSSVLSSYTVTTDGSGQATTVYTAGSATASTAQDVVQASVTGSTRAIIITKTGTAMAVTPAAIYLSASPTSITTNGISTTTISVTAVNTLNASISGIEVTMSSVGPDHGILSAATVTTPGTVNFSSGANKANRTATVTGTSGSVIGQTPVQIIGSTVTVTADTSSISAPTPATSTNLTVAVKDAGGNAISGAAVTVTQSSSDGGSITFGPSATTYIAGTADANGVFTTTAMGLTQGKVTVTATWLGTPGTTTLTVTATGAAFGIEGQYLDGSTTAISGNPHPTAMTINPSGTPYSPHSLKILVNAPGVTTVRFSTTIGEWDSTGNKVTDVAVGSTGDGTGKVSATLTSTYIGVANVQVSDVAHPAIKDNLTVGMGSGEPPNKILLQAAPTVVPVNGGSSTVTATVYDASNNPLGGQPVAFSIVDGTSTSGGETLSDVVLTTATVASGNLSVGQASTSFTSGSMPSSGTGVKIRASVVNTAVQTGTSPSGNDVGILIGGVAGSIAFGQDSKAKEDSSGGNYEFKMSVLVADANGNPVNRAVVNLGVWPIAWCTGAACVCDTDTATTGTFYNEDKNENLILDAGEDGNRIYYYGTFPDATGTADTLITPTNSAGGTVPATVETGTNGVAAFTLTYPKSSARWIYDRIRATTIVQGTETRAEIILHLNVVAGDESVCNESPFKY
jgi:hypothetical protein